jgi:hypothetical protein
MADRVYIRQLSVEHGGWHGSLSPLALAFRSLAMKSGVE